MRIFVGYGYNDRDRWIEDHVLPLLVAFGCDVVHGKVVYGGGPAGRSHQGDSNIGRCLVKIAQALRRFHDLTNVTMIRLGPTPAVEQIGNLLDDRTFTCAFQTLRGVVQKAPELTAVFPIKGGLFVQLRGVAKGEFVRITIAARGRTWRSNYESVDTVDVQVKE